MRTHLRTYHQVRMHEWFVYADKQVDTAGWTNETTFQKYYKKTVDKYDDINFGHKLNA